MYQPAHFREDRLDVQHQFIQSNPLGHLVTAGPSGLIANPLPFFIVAAASPLGTLKGHLARANPQWQQLDSRQEALVIFHGVNCYITPSWYETKQETGKVVPTWNYVAVHVYGKPRVIEDPEWIAAQVTELTRRQEAALAEPWAVSDAPKNFVDAQIKAIVGIEMPINRIEGKWKVSQNRPERDQKRVIEGLRSAGSDVSCRMAELVTDRGGRRQLVSK
jgi:transcriptional regulator